MKRWPRCSYLRLRCYSTIQVYRISAELKLSDGWIVIMAFLVRLLYELIVARIPPLVDNLPCYWLRSTAMRKPLCYQFRAVASFWYIPLASRTGLLPSKFWCVSALFLRWWHLFAHIRRSSHYLLLTFSIRFSLLKNLSRVHQCNVLFDKWLWKDDMKIPYWRCLTFSDKMNIPYCRCLFFFFQWFSKKSIPSLSLSEFINEFSAFV